MTIYEFGTSPEQPRDIQQSNESIHMDFAYTPEKMPQLMGEYFSKDERENFAKVVIEIALSEVGETYSHQANLRPGIISAARMALGLKPLPKEEQEGEI